MMDEALKTQNPGRSYSHTFPDGTWVQIHVNGGEPKPPPKKFSALQRDTHSDLPFAITLGEGHFIKKDQINWPGIISACQTLIPGDFTGPVLIDIESPFNGDGTVKPPWTVELLRNVALYCRNLRPKVQWGWYLPTREYWSQTDAWRSNNLALVGITEVGKALMPSCYDYYGVNPKRDHARFGAIIELALEMAVTGQEVLPYTHHRYHNSTVQYGYQLIPRDEHVEHMRNLVQHGADGVIAWGGDRSNFVNAWKREPDGQFTNVGSSWDRIRQAWRDETGGGNDPSVEEIEGYLFDVLYPEVHDRLHSL